MVIRECGGDKAYQEEDDDEYVGRGWTVVYFHLVGMFDKRATERYRVYS